MKQTLEKELEPLGVNIADILPTSSGKEDAPEVPKAAESIKKKKSKALRRRVRVPPLMMIGKMPFTSLQHLLANITMHNRKRG